MGAYVPIKSYLPKQMVGLYSVEMGWLEGSTVRSHRLLRRLRNDDVGPRYSRMSGTVGILNRVAGWNCWPSITLDGDGLGRRHRVINGKDNTQVSDL